MVDGLTSAKLKIIRAAKHLKSIRFHISTYAKRKPREIVPQPDGKEKVGSTEPAPLPISLLAGEVIYQLRSALDHLVFSLIELNPDKVILKSDWWEHSEFPLLVKLPMTGTPALPADLYLRKKRISEKLPGVRDKAVAFIEAAQPYNAVPGLAHIANRTRYIALLSNIDKHRHLHLMKPRLAHHETITGDRTRISSVRRIEEGTELDPVATVGFDGKEPVQVKRRISASVSFDEAALPDGARTLPVEYLLQACIEVVAADIIPAFEEFLENP